MIQVPSSGCLGDRADPKTNNKYDRLRRKSLAFLSNLFKLRRRNNCFAAGMRIDEQPSYTTMQRSPRLENPGVGVVGGCGVSVGCRPHSGLHESGGGVAVGCGGEGGEGMTGAAAASSVSRIPSTLSVTAVDVVVAAQTCRQAGASPSHSILTLTPGRTRNIDQDMEALRLSRQDNPYLQLLASKESLIEPVEESESDDAILMSQEFGDNDPLTLAQVHEHLVRSPPPASWSRSPMFHFPQQQQTQQHQPQDSPGSKSDSSGHLYRTTSPKSMLHRSADDQPKSEGSMEIRDRHSHTFSLLNPTPIRSLSEVRRLHRSADDSVQLMSSE